MWFGLVTLQELHGSLSSVWQTFASSLTLWTGRGKGRGWVVATRETVVPDFRTSCFFPFARANGVYLGQLLSGTRTA